MKEKINLVDTKAGEKTTKQIQDELMFKNDTLRKKYDLRYVDTDRVNNIFLRGYIRKLKKATEEGKEHLA